MYIYIYRDRAAIGLHSLELCFHTNSSKVKHFTWLRFLKNTNTSTELRSGSLMFSLPACFRLICDV